MKKKFNKILAVVIVALLCVSLLPISALAGDSAPVVDGENTSTVEPTAPAETEEPTEPANEPPAEVVGEEPPAPAGEAPVEPADETPVEPAGEVPVEPAGGDSVPPATEGPTEPATEEPVAPASEGPTEPAAEEPVVSEEEPTEPVVETEEDPVPATHVVNFWNEAGDAEPLVSVSVPNGQTIVSVTADGQMPAAAEKADMVFAGWFDAADALYDETTVIENVEDATTALEINLLPRYTNAGDSAEDEGEDDLTVEQTVTVTFMIGETVYSSYPAEAGAALTPPATPGQELFPEGAVSFRGWFTEADEAFEFAGATVPAEGLTLYAKFSNTYLIKYVDALGTTQISHEVAADARITEPNAEEMARLQGPAGTHFVYWYKEGDAARQEYAPWGTFPTSDLTLVAYFSAEYMVYFISSGTQLPDSQNPQMVDAGQTAVQPQTSPTRVGYNFKWWSATENGPQFIFADNPITSDLFLYAVWTPAQVNYKVVYWFEKPNVAGDPGATNTNYAYYKEEIKTALAGSTVDHTTATGLSGINYGEFHHGGTAKVAGNGTTVVNVYFNRIVYTINFSLTPYNGRSASITFTSGSLTGTTYTQSASNGGTYTPAAAYVLYAKYEQDVKDLFPISGNANIVRTGGQSQNNTYFNSWDYPGAGYGVQSNVLSMTTNLLPSPDSDSRTVNVTPNWADGVNTYTVNYYFERLPGESGGVNYGGTWYVKSDEYSQTYKSGSSGLQAKNIAGMTCVNPNQQTGSTKNFYYMRARHDLSFDLQGGANTGNAFATLRNQMYGDSIDRILTANNIPEPTREGYEFTGWYLDSKYTMPYTPGMTMPNSALTLYAEWEATAYDVNYYDETVSAGSIWHDGYDDGDYVVHPTAIGGIPYVADGSWVEGKGEFLGWYWYVGGRLVSFSTDTPIEKSISL